MADYIVTGGVNGIGKAAVDLLRANGDRVLVIDNEGGDICADLSGKEGRQEAISKVYSSCPDGIDGLACIAGISSPKPNNSSILSTNYYGAVEVAEGLFPLLEKRKGSCVMITSASITWSAPDRTPNIGELLANCPDEERIGRLADSFPADPPYNLYYSTKLALSLWVRRNSIEWGIRGVRLNSIAPGCVDTRLGSMTDEKKEELRKKGIRMNESFHKTIPTHYRDHGIMPPEDIAETIAFMLSDKSRGINGVMVIADAGQEAYYNTEKVYF